MIDQIAPATVVEHAVVPSDFAFPLNVYARMLQLQEGKVDYLHYGIFSSDGESVLAAQERASALMWQVLPGPCRLIEVGIGLGTTLARLMTQGYAAVGITPDASQVAAARFRFGPGLPVALSRLEEFSQSAGEWDAILFQESAQYIEPLELFASANRLLKSEQATMVVMDEFALSRRAVEHTGLHQLDDFCALAARCGWRLDHRVDLSRQARPTLGYIARTVATHRQQLIDDLHVTADQLMALDASTQHYQRLYEQGIYGYALLRFKRERASSSRLLYIDLVHSPAMMDLFAKVFRTAMSPQQWAWKYGDGRGRAVGLQQDGRLAAHYGGVARPVSYLGRPAMACQVCDVMVDQSANTSLTRRGAMYQVAATFLENEIGWGCRHLVGFGFPSARAFGVAQRLGLYAEVDRIAKVAWPGDASVRPASVFVAPLGEHGALLSSRDSQAVDRLWQAMVQAFPDSVLGKRDAAWIQHRYLQRPDCRYELLLVRRRWTRRPVGVVVMRRHEQHLEVLDFVAPPSHFGVLVSVARAHAAASGLGRVECWITSSHRHLVDGIDPEHVTVTDLDIHVPTSVHTAGPSVDDLRGRWFLMAGDADFT